MELVEESENILTSHQKIERKSPSAQCGNTAAVKHFANDPFADTDEQ